MEEEFIDVPGYEGLYQVSNLGNLKSLKFGKQKILKLVANSNGYYENGLLKNNKNNRGKIHQLVAMAFLGHKPDGTHKLVVDHINDNKLDNRVENLQIVTQRFNCRKNQIGYSSKYKGVGWNKTYNKWRSRIMINKKEIHLGYFENELEAHLAYQNKLKEII